MARFSLAVILDNYVKGGINVTMRSILILLVIGALLPCILASRREEVADVREGQDVTLPCRFNNPSLVSSDGQFYWMRQRYGEKDNVAIAGKAFDRNYRVDLSAEQGRYDLTISRATYDRDNGMFECRVKEPGTGSDLHTTTVNLTVLIPPGSPRISPEAPSATEGQLVDLVCSSQGGSPDPEITWYRQGSEQKMYSVLKPGGGRDFPTTSVLTVNPGKEDDGAKYRCVVWNRALSDEEKMETSVTLNVNYYPRLTVGPENPLRVELGGSVSLTCSADAKPAVSNVRWTRNGRFLDTANLLRRERVTLDDAGRYVCQADNGLGRLKEAEVMLDVLHGPRVRLVTSQEAEEGEEVTVTCNVTANPASVSIEWLKQGDDSFHQSGDILRLPRITAANQGSYICRAVNVLIPTGGESIEKVGNATVAVRVFHGPGKAFVTPGEPIAVQGEPFTLTCDADPPGWPQSTYRWWRRDSDSTLTIGANYTISAASVEDEGIYFCQPSNRLGRSNPASVSLRVLQAPKILEGLSESSVHPIGKTDLSLTCRAEGKPEPSISWLKDGQEISPIDGLYDIQAEQSALGHNEGFTVQTTLIFRGPSRINDNQVMPQDRGTYQCVFKNDAKKVFSSQLLRVQHSPIVVHKANKVAYDTEEDATIECRMQAFPEPSFQWSHGTDTIEADNIRYSVNDSVLADDVYISILTVRAVKESDYGSYTCRGRNNMGDHKTIVTLQPKGPPEPPTTLRSTAQGTETVELAWDPGFNGGVANTKFYVSSSSGGVNSVRQEYDCQTRNPCLVGALKQQTTYRFQVKAYNPQGESSFSDIVETMTTVDAASIPTPVEVYLEATSNYLSFKVDPPTQLILEGRVEVRPDEDAEWGAMPNAADLDPERSEMYLGDEGVGEVRIRLCTLGGDVCGAFVEAKKVDMLPARSPRRMSMQYLIAIIVGCIVAISIVALVFVCCCCRRRNSKLKAKAAEMEVSHRGVVTQQVPPPPYYTVGMDNKGMQNSLDNGLDEQSKMALYGTQHYSYNHNGHLAPAPNNNGLTYMDNSYSNSNNGGSVNSQDSLWQVKNPGGAVEPVMSANDPRAYQYDPVAHGGYAIAGYDDYSHYPLTSPHPNQNAMDEYNYNADPYGVNRPRKNISHNMDGSYNVSGMPDPYLQQQEHQDSKPQINFDESLESGYSTPNSRNRRIIREIIV